MNSTETAIAVESSHCYSKIKSFIEQLIKEFKEQEQDLEFLKRSPKNTSIINKQISVLQEKISSKKNIISEAKSVLKFPLNSWVVLHSDNTNRPGRVVNLELAGRIPRLQVLWDDCRVTVPERAGNLRLVEDFKCQYLWNGDHRSKLVRLIDNRECNDVYVLVEELNSLNFEIKSESSLEFQEELKERIHYCTKRIDYLDGKQLEQLEIVVKQGLASFYRFGEALTEIRDRKLYKRHGYTDFRVYLKEHWNMGKSRAYQLIDSAKVVKNISQSETVHHGGQNLIPQSERIAREVSKAPSNLQAEIMEKCIEKTNGNPTAKDVKKVIAEIVHDQQKNELNQDSSQVNQDSNSLDTRVCTVEPFKVGQVVEIDSDRTDERLIGHNMSYGLIVKINAFSVDLKLWGGLILEAISPNDIRSFEADYQPTICVSFKLEKIAQLLAGFDSQEELFDIAIAAKSLNL